jgi:hypothetical protein
MAQRRGVRSNVGESAATRGGELSPASPVASAARPPRWTSGRECWVFRAETPDELCGHHAELIGSALTPGETVQYLLYSPLCEARDGPFNVGGVPGSHAVALTTMRLLVSHDPHSDRGGRSVRAIDLGAVDSLEIGGALTLAWFVVRYSGPAGPASCPVLFSAHGLDHFRAIVRAYLDRRPHAPAVDASALRWPGVLRETPAFLASELAPLTRDMDPPLEIVRTPERWTRERRPWGSRAVCLSAMGLLAATPLGLLCAASEPPTSPGGVSFGVNVTAVRSDRVASAFVSSRTVNGTAVSLLRVHAGAASGGTELEVPFDERDRASAERLAQLASSGRGGW